MSSNTSPSHYSDLDDAFITDAQFKLDINQKMKVPHKISFNQDLSSMNGVSNWNDNINMQVPERILVVGRDQHVGTKAPPREIILDNSLLQQHDQYSDPRVGTPPRTLTLDRYPFPGVEEPEDPPMEKIPVAKPQLKIEENVSYSLSLIKDSNTSSIGAGGDGLSVEAEVVHLRKQLAKLNSRVMALELENLNRLQKEKIIYGLGIAYFLLKAIIWLNRN